MTESAGEIVIGSAGAPVPETAGGRVTWPGIERAGEAVVRPVGGTAPGQPSASATGPAGEHSGGPVPGSGGGHASVARLVIDQRVVVTKPLLRALAPVARPLFRANHTLMMRRGQRGLRAYLG